MILLETERGEKFVPCVLHFAQIPVQAWCSCLRSIFIPNAIRRSLKPGGCRPRNQTSRFQVPQESHGCADKLQVIYIYKCQGSREGSRSVTFLMHTHGQSVNCGFVIMHLKTWEWMNLLKYVSVCQQAFLTVSF